MGLWCEKQAEIKWSNTTVQVAVLKLKRFSRHGDNETKNITS